MSGVADRAPRAAAAPAFHAPRTVGEALALLAREPGLRVVAGGTDVMPRAGAAPHGWLSLHAVEGLAGVRPRAGGGLRIGAGTTHAALAGDPCARTRAAAVAQASALVGSPATRTVATIGGNLVNGSPAMELGPPLLALGARVELTSAAGGARILALADFLRGPGRVELGEGELLTAVELPGEDAASDGRASGSAYARVAGRAAMEVALASAAAWVELAAGGRTIAAARVALGAVAPTCVRAPAAERLLIGAPAADGAFAAAGEAAVRHAAPIGDHRAPAAYRAAMVAVVVRRAVAAACARAREGGR